MPVHCSVTYVKVPQKSSKIDDIVKPDEGQDDHESAEEIRLEIVKGDSDPGQDSDLENDMKVFDLFMGIVNPDSNEQVSELEKGRKSGGEVDVPLQIEPKRKVLNLEVGCDPSKNMPLLGGNLITNVKVKGGPLIANKSPRHRATGLRTLDNSLDDPMEPDRFTQHRWKQYHRWPPPF